VLERRGLDKRRRCHRRRLSDGALSAVEHEPEVMHVDYTPVTARRPIDSRAALRPHSMGRTIKLFITITAYNEGGKELHQTLQAVATNMGRLKEICGISWKEVLILIVQDGREKMAKTMEVFLRKNRLWDRRMLLAEHEGMPVTCHVFERTVNLVKSRTTREYFPSMQVVFAAKEKNGGKLNSHLWAFSAFARQFQPEFLLLLDVGTMPREFAIARMINAMQVNPQVAGVCGEIAVHEPNYGSFVQAAQAFEYAIQHVLDKSFESICVSRVADAHRGAIPPDHPVASLVPLSPPTPWPSCARRASSACSPVHSAPTAGRPCAASRSTSTSSSRRSPSARSTLPSPTCTL